MNDAVTSSAGGCTLNVLHTTAYRYSLPVEHAQQRAVVTPPDLPWQRVTAHETRIDPAPTHQHVRIDAFGNRVLHFMLDVPHTRMQLTCASTVVLKPRWQALDPSASAPWETVAQALRFHAGQPFDVATQFVFASPNIALHPSLREYALPSLAQACLSWRGRWT